MPPTYRPVLGSELAALMVYKETSGVLYQITEITGPLSRGDLGKPHSRQVTRISRNGQQEIVIVYLDSVYQVRNGDDLDFRPAAAELCTLLGAGTSRRGIMIGSTEDLGNVLEDLGITWRGMSAQETAALIVGKLVSR